MYWKDTDKICYHFNYNNLYYNNVNNAQLNVFENRRYWYEFITNGYCYPRQKLSDISSNFEVMTVKPESKLFFDPGSGFPRFKLGLTDNKRCIKTTKADYIVVSGKKDYKTPDAEHVVLEDDNGVYIINKDEWDQWFSGRLDVFINGVCAYKTFKDVKVIHIGRLTSYAKDSVWLAKYAEGEYTLNYITDVNLDKQICSMCPEPTFDELCSIIDMLNSDDAAVVQLAIKTLSAYDIAKYKLTFRLILYTRRGWYEYSKNLVATKQLIETLGLNRYYVYDDFAYGAKYADDQTDTYTIEDIALSKQIGLKLTQEWLQKMYKDNFQNANYRWLPNERKVTLS